MAFYLGPVVFQIKNQFLVFPFAPGQHPFDASVCGRADISDLDRSICAAPKKAVFLRIPLPDSVLGGSAYHFVSQVTLGYGQQYVFDESPINEFASETHSWEGGRERTERVDTASYAAVHVLRPKHLVNVPPLGETYYFINKTDKLPHVVACGVAPNESDIPAKTICSARTGFLTDEFPRQSNGEFPFTLEYNFPGAEIDHAPEIQVAVLKAVSAFLHYPAPSASSAKQPVNTEPK